MRERSIVGRPRAFLLGLTVWLVSGAGPTALISVEAQESGEDTAATCPCGDPAKWSTPFIGRLWQGLADGQLDSTDTACQDSAGQTQLTNDPADAPMRGAAADSARAECQVFKGRSTKPVGVLKIERDEAEACRELLREAAAKAEVSCSR